MSEKEIKLQDFNRRDFLRNGSVATLMAMMGGVELFGQTNAATADVKAATLKLKIGVIGLGTWGREVVNTLALIPYAEVAAICDTYPASVKRCADIAPKAIQTADYKTLLENKEISAVVVATPTHQHKDIVIAALKAGKHVYCEAPLANTIEDAQAIAAAAKAAKTLVFQAGLQMRANPQRNFLLPFIRSGALGKTAMARGQWHKKTSWRATSPNPAREAALNWRLSKATSLGLAGEVGIHPVDQVSWYLNLKPTAITGFGNTVLWQDTRDVPDTVQAVVEFPGGVNMTYDATLANSFDGEYEVIYGSDAAVLMREDKAWMFKEVDSALLGWEVYAKKETFYKETGIVLKAGASKAVQNEDAAPPPFTKTPLAFALTIFSMNAGDYTATTKSTIDAFGDDPETLAAELAKLKRRPAAGFLEGLQATVTAIKMNEAIMGRTRVELKPDLYELK